MRSSAPSSPRVQCRGSSPRRRAKSSRFRAKIRSMPELLGVLETVLYVEDFARACPFYEQALGLNSIYRDQRLCAYDVGHRGALLLFLRGHSLETVRLPGGTIPPYDGHGPVHIAFSIAAADRADWEARLKEAGVVIEGRTIW